LSDENIVEAALFSSGRPLKLSEIEAATSLNAQAARRAIKRLIAEYEKRDSAIEIVKLANKYSMQLKEEYSGPAFTLSAIEIPRKYLKTAALIAFHQPIKQSELAEMAGGKVYEHVKALQESGMIRSKPYGNTKILSTSKKFLDHFGIDAKKPEEIKRWLAERTREDEK
jgi:segregation and condensation protein B